MEYNYEKQTIQQADVFVSQVQENVKAPDKIRDGLHKIKNENYNSRQYSYDDSNLSIFDHATSKNLYVLIFL